jgi:hypothetical protein
MNHAEIQVRLAQLAANDTAGASQLAAAIAADSRTGGEVIVGEWAKAPGGHAPNAAFVAADLQETAADAMLRHADEVSPALRARFFDLLTDAGVHLLRTVFAELRPLLEDHSRVAKSSALTNTPADWRTCDEAYVLMRRVVPAHHKPDPLLAAEADFGAMKAVDRDAAIKQLKGAKAAKPRE